jgi:hypothetical protein
MSPAPQDWRARARVLSLNGCAFIDGKYVAAASGATCDKYTGHKTTWIDLS